MLVTTNLKGDDWWEDVTSESNDERVVFCKSIREIKDGRE